MIKRLTLACIMALSLTMLSIPATKAEGPISGIASWYECTAGWCDGTPTVALAGFLGGRYTGHVNGYVEVCGDRCVLLPVVDYCQCYEGTSTQRIVDLNKAAWALVTDKPYSAGLVAVTMTIDIPQPGIGLPDTAMR